MQPNYLERVSETRKNTAQRQTQEQDLGAMLAELKKMQMAALIGGKDKSTVILTDQTDLGDKMEAAIGKIAELVKVMGNGEHDAEELTMLKKLVGTFDGYFKRVDSETAKIVSAIKSIDMSPVLNVPAPVVNSPAVDLTGVEQAIEKFMTPVDVEESPDRCDLSRYRAQDISESGDCQYVGFVNPEGNWYIIENDMAKNRMRYVFGTGNYARTFRNAATYEYKLLDKAYRASA